jgi:uncharacterized membrane protein YbhN (UPF0104 family)
VGDRSRGASYRDGLVATTQPKPREAEMPEELNPRHLRKRLLQLALVVVVVIAVVVAAPGLGELRAELKDASPGWFVLGIGLELLSMLSYVVVFRAVFCPRMKWRMSYQIGMAEQAANSLLPAGGAGGLALGAWALRRGGTPADHIARRTVAFFLLTSLANVGTLIVFAVGFAVGILGHDPAPGATFGFAGVAVFAIAIVTIVVPVLTGRYVRARRPLPPDAPRLRVVTRRGIEALGDGVRDGLWLVRRRQLGVLTGSFGYMAFDIAVLAVCFRAFGQVPPIGVLVVAYIIGLLGGILPVPGGIGGTEGGLIGVLALYHAPLATTTAAVLAYRAIQLWLPALLGSLAFVQLRNALRREAAPAALCAPLADKLETVQLPASAG